MDDFLDGLLVGGAVVAAGIFISNQCYNSGGTGATTLSTSCKLFEVSSELFFIAPPAAGFLIGGLPGLFGGGVAALGAGLVALTGIH